MLDKYPKCHEALFGIGKNYFHLGEFEKAKTFLERAIKVKKDYTYIIWSGYTCLFYGLQLTKIINCSKDNKQSIEKAKSTREKCFSQCLKHLKSTLLISLSIIYRVQ